MTSPSIDPRPRTRILATLGPASWDLETTRALVQAGASGFRLNFSHGRHDVLGSVIDTVREVATESGRPLALMADLAGPKLRTRKLATDREVDLEDGEEVELSSDFEATAPGRIAVGRDVLSGRLEPGTRILLADGRLELRVLESVGRRVRARVIHGGRLGSNKGVNLPGVHLEVPSLSDKDRDDLRFALQRGVEFIALSFAREPGDVVEVKRLIAHANRDAAVIAKIETPIAVENLDALLEVSDGIMVARGDLGVELGPEILPVVQKQIIQDARRRGKLVLTATQMLESMTRSPRPTRAEASDVANAIFDGSDVVMLSEETAIGAHPVEAVRVMARIALNAEQSSLYPRVAALHQPDVEGVAMAAIEGACVAAEKIRARALICFTSSGWTAFATSAWRPDVDLVACTPSRRSFHRLALCWGTTPFLTPQARDLDDLYATGVETLLARDVVFPGDMVVLLSGSVVAGTGANTMKIYRVGTADISEDAETRRRLQDLA